MSLLKYLVDSLVYQVLGMQSGSTAGEALDFFFYDAMKVFLLLVFIVFAVAIVRSFFPPEKTRKLLANRREYVGNFLAALLGIVTPFCSCSAIPMFIGFVEAGLPLGVTFSFLIASPTVNEVALVMLWGLFGWRIALLYATTGVALAFIGGVLIGKLKLEHLVEPYVYQIKMGEAATIVPTWRERLGYARDYTRDILGRVWFFVLLGIGVGAWIHGFVPVDFVIRYAGPHNPFAVILAVLLGIPLYANAAGTIPIVQALVEKGLPMGTALAFMMSIVAISAPELIILRKVIKLKLIAIFVGIVALAIIIIGYLFNVIL
jgi:uncharacterized membrane protein YraQ (UPF0718 family)